MSLTCSKFVELVTEYLDEVMDEQARIDFEEHLALCPGCETYLEQFREVIRQSGRLQAEDLSVEARERLLAAFDDWPRS
jgi:predicted anti-sigma-YlaC factor YlaD